MNRRQLIKTSVLAGSGVLLNQAVLGQTQTGNQAKIGIAILGLGYFASYVAPKIQTSTHSKITALISSDINKAKQWAQQYGLSDRQIYSYDEMHKIANDDNIDAVYIATPVGTHAQFAIKACHAGKHVMVEKTMAATSEQARQMMAAADQHNRIMMVAYRARYEPFNQQAIHFARQETFGAVRSIAAHKGFNIGNKTGKNGWRLNKKLAGGGALVDIGIYSIQACRYIAGTEPSEVYATSQTINEGIKEVEDHMSFMLKFPDGVLATGSASWGYDLQNHYTVGTQTASYALNPATSNLNLRLHVTEHHPKTVTEHHLRNTDQIDAEFAHFANCIHKNQQPLTCGAEGLKDLLVIEALYQSIDQHKPIKI